MRNLFASAFDIQDQRVGGVRYVEDGVAAFSRAAAVEAVEANV